MTPPDPLIGALFDGRYKILKKLGMGGMATVYLAEDQELGRRIAIKILNAKHASDKQFVERFRREASSAAGLSHPNIVQIYDRGNAEGTYYIAMEVIEGRSLKELVIERGPSPILVAVNYGRQILAALRFAHRNGVVHRDIKPHNVLVDDEGRVKVTDFGIARAGASEMTEVGSIIGTAQYLSPEQARGAPVDDRSDLYSVGVLLYELLTGEAPFNGDTPVEIAMKHLSAVPEPPSAKRPEVSPVTIWVSKGPPPIPVPDVVGSLYNTAYHTLKDAGFNVQKQLDTTSTEPKGTITNQDPRAGSPPQSPGSPITLSVSIGPPPERVHPHRPRPEKPKRA